VHLEQVIALYNLQQHCSHLHSAPFFAVLKQFRKSR
jgi:hypothetical protein